MYPKDDFDHDYDYNYNYDHNYTITFDLDLDLGLFTRLFFPILNRTIKTLFLHRFSLMSD